VSIAVSVVIPVHNAEALTRRCIDAVLADLPVDAELIVVDDASTDSTPELLAGYGDAIRRLRFEVNAGFATACNEGAAAAHGDALVFLNNDTEPRQGWLTALRRYATGHPRAAIVGARLLYPSGAVQHAGVVFGQDGYPHHLYAGLPGDHPAVCHPRRLQAVTAACMLIERPAFDRVGGFDRGFLNSLEDVDLCLRVGAAGDEVHYCPEAVVVHLESASRGRSERFEQSVALYQERWRDRVRRDDFEAYLSDGLLEVEYADSHPVRLAVDPLLAVVDRGREEEIERLLEAYARQNADLLLEVVRLSALTGNGDEDEDDAPLAALSEISADRSRILTRAREIEAEIRELQGASQRVSGLEPGPRLGYGHLVEQVRETVDRQVPAGARVLVVSRGDRELVRMRGRRAGHFPQDEEGRYAGHHPADSGAAVAELERLRGSGAQYLVFPPSALWWLDHYREFAQHLGRNYQRLGSDSCQIFELSPPVPAA